MVPKVDLVWLSILAEYSLQMTDSFKTLSRSLQICILGEQKNKEHFFHKKINQSSIYIIYNHDLTSLLYLFPVYYLGSLEI